MSNENFFDEKTEASSIKTRIVSKYFKTWANIISNPINVKKIVYFELYCGKGKYEDGSYSTPLKILETAIKNPKLCDILAARFVDANKKYIDALDNEIKGLRGVEKLKHKPKAIRAEVNDELSSRLEKLKLVPTLLFIDPWGYKGLSKRLIQSVIKDWGCDCIFFFNYNRINPALSNPQFKNHMDAFFGEDCAALLRAEMENSDKSKRYELITNAVVEALEGATGNYVLPFCFKKGDSSRVSHHLVFVSKKFIGYGIMKEIMAQESCCQYNDVSTFEYDPSHIAQVDLTRQIEAREQLDNLKEQLLQDFAGRSLSMKEIYVEHSVNKCFISRNYKTILLELEQEERIKTSPSERRKNSFADTVMVTFPK